MCWAGRWPRQFGLGVVGWVAVTLVAAALYDHVLVIDVAIMAASLPF